MELFEQEFFLYFSGKIQGVNSIGWPRIIRSESRIWQKFVYWCGGQGLLGVCAGIHWGGIREGWVVVIDSSPVLNRKFLGSAIIHLVKS